MKLKKEYLAPYPWNIRDEMDKKILNLLQPFSSRNTRASGLPPLSQILNMASHPDGKYANEMICVDVVRAYKSEIPIKHIKFALNQAFQWRKIMLEVQPRTERTNGEITLVTLKENYKGIIPEDIFKKLFE